MDKYLKAMGIYFELRGAPETTKKAYIRRARTFMKYILQQKSLDDVTEYDIQQYILYLKNQKKLSAGTINTHISAIRVLYVNGMDKEWNSKKIPRMKRKISFPVIPSRQDILLIIDKATNLKYKAILTLLYGSGLRVSEVAKLKISDICSKTMRVRVEYAKHDTNRYTILSKNALIILRKYFKAYFSNTKYNLDDWLFPGRYKNDHISVKSIRKTLIKIKNSLNLDLRISTHTLRHGFAVYSMEDGIDPVFIQQMLGHKQLQATTAYLKMTSKSMMGIKSPLDIETKDDASK